MNRKHVSALSERDSLWVRRGDQMIALVFGSSNEEKVDNTMLIIDAWNACIEINPDNPAAAAAAMPEMFRLILAVVVDARNGCSKSKLDLEEWLKKAEATVDKAMKEQAS